MVPLPVFHQHRLNTASFPDHRLLHDLVLRSRLESDPWDPVVCADDIVQGKWPFSCLAEQTCFSFQSMSQIMQTLNGKFCLLVTISSGSNTVCLAG